MNQKRPPSYGFCPVQGATKGIPKQSLAKSLALLVLIYGKAGHKNDRHGVTPLTFGDAIGRRFWRHGSRSKAVIADYAFASRYNIGSRSSAGLVLKSILSQKIIQGRFAAIKAGDLMALGKQRR